MLLPCYILIRNTHWPTGTHYAPMQTTWRSHTYDQTMLYLNKTFLTVLIFRVQFVVSLKFWIYLASLSSRRIQLQGKWNDNLIFYIFLKYWYEKVGRPFGWSKGLLWRCGEALRSAYRRLLGKNTTSSLRPADCLLNASPRGCKSRSGTWFVNYTIICVFNY